MLRMLLYSLAGHAILVVALLALILAPGMHFRSKKPEKVRVRIVGSLGPAGAVMAQGPAGAGQRRPAPATPQVTPILTPVVSGPPRVIKPETETKRTPPPTPKPTQTPPPTPAPKTPAPRTPTEITPAPIPEKRKIPARPTKGAKTPKASSTPTATPYRPPEPSPGPPSAQGPLATPDGRATPYLMAQATPLPGPQPPGVGGFVGAPGMPGGVATADGMLTVGAEGAEGDVELPAYYPVNALMAIKRNFRPLQRVHAQCRVRFTVTADGTIKEPEVIASSGNPFLDDLAIQALVQTRALQPLPDSVRVRISSLRMLVTFDFSQKE